MKKVALHNLGCKVNAYEMEAMEERLKAAGYEIVPFEKGADIYIVNTCTVTNVADRKSRQMLHRARKWNPDAIIVAAGCYVQTQSEEEIDPCVDIVIGNNRKGDLIDVLASYESGQMPARDIEDIDQTRTYEDLTRTNTSEHTRAYVKVQDGCNQFCSYCIIPYARGRARSRESSQILEEVKRLAENGYREVVLSGIHLSSYGTDFEGKDSDLLSLIQGVHEIDGIDRIRLSSLEPRAMTEDFVKELSQMPKICPHFHLSLQSGCDETLRRMNRKYTTAEYEETCQRIRSYFDHPALTTDVIVGFPGESEEEFEQSFAFVDRQNFYETHIFKYSMRKGTKAADMPDQVPEDEKARRSRLLIELGGRKQSAFESDFLGKTVEVLFEEQQDRDGETLQVGHTREYLKVGLKSEEILQNQIRQGRIGTDFEIIH